MPLPGPAEPLVALPRPDKSLPVRDAILLVVRWFEIAGPRLCSPVGFGMWDYKGTRRLCGTYRVGFLHPETAEVVADVAMMEAAEVGG